MKIETFELERRQSVWENRVRYNLTESGVHPYMLSELLTDDELKDLFSIRLGYGQTNGSIELREAISLLYPGTNLDNVLVTNGSSEGNFIGTWSTLEPKDELILMLPNYLQIWGIAQSFGVTVKPFHLKEHLNWQPEIEELEGLLSPRTKMITVCNPNNPTGAVLEEEIMQEIVHLAKKADAWIYSDEIYQGAELEGDETSSFWGLYDKTIISCGLSKAYALPGLRIGWLIGPKKTIEKMWSYHDYTSIASGILSNRIATLVLQPERRQKVLERNRKMLRGNLIVLTKWVAKHSDIFQFIPPQAGGIAFLKYNMNINSTELTTKLREEKSVFIVAGDCFGLDHYIRIGIGSEKNYLLAGLELIDELLEELR
ncbi:MAG: aminotransferase class I/II-fold pyridoxal phosphate-dependent enzyme [Candidatus Heimdallarchaeota archaeon]|nr:MAG: aminotransferase class I/II-fold pyridoxal phosphate-dependent enzyme [Candidatus Heimdallarchaeota archaeon]